MLSKSLFRSFINRIATTYYLFAATLSFIIINGCSTTKVEVKDATPLKEFPLTRQSTLTGNVFGSQYDEWKSNKNLTGLELEWREHIPDYINIKSAFLRFDKNQKVRISFPLVEIEREVIANEKLDISSWIATGRHTYKVVSLDDQTINLYSEITIQRPTVRAENEAYLIDKANIKYSQRHWLEDDRAQQRVGRTEFFVKTLPQDFHTTTLKDKVNLNGKWKYKKVKGLTIEDYSQPWLNDSSWQSVNVPHTWEKEFSDWDGKIWYRKNFSVPLNWAKQETILRFSGIDDQPRIFLNGHEVGYNCGWHRPFQLDVSDYIIPGRENVIAMLVSRRNPQESTWVYDGGMVYGFIKDFILSGYPKKTEYLGGIFGEINEIGTVETTGSVLFQPRIHPNLEGLIQYGFIAENASKKTPLNFSTKTVLSYRPPVMSYDGLNYGTSNDGQIKTIVGYDQDIMLVEGNTPSSDYATIQIKLVPSKLGEDFKVSVQKQAEALKIVINENTPYATINFPKNKVLSIDIQKNLEAPYHKQNITVDVRLKTNTGQWQVATVPNWQSELMAKTPNDNGQSFSALEKSWEEHIFRYSNPLQMSEAAAASYRNYKQVLSLDAKDVEGEIKGLFTSLIKYPVFWLRDGSISVPGALYGGERSNAIAVNFAGEVYDVAKKNIDNVILNPDGSFSPGRRASDAATLSIYAIYKVWCQEGDDWLKEHYPSVLTYLGHAVQVDQYHGDPADGIIRASDGDWYDSAYKLKYLRKGASLFVQVNYLRALKHGSKMAQAMGDTENQKLWSELYEKGKVNFVKPIREGGYLLPEQGYLADCIMKLDSLGGWKFPDDLENVHVFKGFRPLPHSIALIEDLIDSEEIKQSILKYVDEYDVLTPVPGLTQYPFNDYMKAEKESGEYELTPFNYSWKVLPGNQAAGGRWPFVGGIIENALWHVGDRRLGEVASKNLSGYLLSAWQPARPTEDIHASGLFRNEAGSPIDTEGFYFLWGSATPMEALVEGRYGIRPNVDGFSIDPKNCDLNDGIENVAMRKGVVSYKRTANDSYMMKLDQPRAGTMTFIISASQKAKSCTVSLNGKVNNAISIGEENKIEIPFEAGISEITVVLQK